ncbi:MAG: menaquinone-specific isochorismate synthase [Thermoleophilaceae bacterium]|nr:menaquinone-specific isochorismate synthase [Thermoleophilaceae bacterium]
MPSETRFEAGSFGLDVEQRRRLTGYAERAVKSARGRPRPSLASITLPIPGDLDVAAAVLAARRPGERCFCLEHPDRGGFALAALGQAVLLEGSGTDRVRGLVRAIREFSDRAVGDSVGPDPDAPRQAGPVWVGGLAFAPDGGKTPEWAGLAPAQLVMPELLVARHEGHARLTLVAALEGDESPDAVVERLERRLADLRPADVPLADPDPVTAPVVSGRTPPAHYESAVARAVERIVAGQVGKVVLAREVRVDAPSDIDPAPVFDGLRSVFPACYSYLVAGEGFAFVGASPELLVRREGARAQTVALAGTTRRSADPSVDSHLGEQLLNSPKDREEQAIVARRIERSLKPASVWVAVADEPVLVQVHNVQHLATPIRAQLRAPLTALELADMLHPTPAVGGEPSEVALKLIPELEGLDRGWYAGAVGYVDPGGDGEFCVAIRCALLRGPVAHLYAGCGIVRDSVPAEELAESEVKLQALLPLLT